MERTSFDTVFFDYRGVVHTEFLPSGSTVTTKYYLGVMKRPCELIRRNLWENNSWFLHYDNAPAHISLLVREFLSKNSINVIPQTPYSPDLVPSDYFLFPKLKLLLQGRRFESVGEIQRNSLTKLKIIFIRIRFPEMFRRLGKALCTASGGDYFKGDQINIDE